MTTIIMLCRAVLRLAKCHCLMLSCCPSNHHSIQLSGDSTTTGFPVEGDALSSPGYGKHLSAMGLGKPLDRPKRLV